MMIAAYKATRAQGDEDTGLRRYEVTRVDTGMRRAFRTLVLMACRLTLCVCGMASCWDDDALYTNYAPELEPSLLMNLLTRTF